VLRVERLAVERMMGRLVGVWSRSTPLHRCRQLTADVEGVAAVVAAVGVESPVVAVVSAPAVAAVEVVVAPLEMTFWTPHRTSCRVSLISEDKAVVQC
jgi:hypothetical protein